MSDNKTATTIKQAIDSFLLSCKVEGKSYGPIELRLSELGAVSDHTADAGQCPRLKLQHHEGVLGDGELARDTKRLGRNEAEALVEGRVAHDDHGLLAQPPALRQAGTHQL